MYELKNTQQVTCFRNGFNLFFYLLIKNDNFRIQCICIPSPVKMTLSNLNDNINLYDFFFTQNNFRP